MAMPAMVPHQQEIAHKLEVIDRWGKILTVVTVVFGLILGGLWVYQGLAERFQLYGALDYENALIAPSDGLGPLLWLLLAYRAACTGRDDRLHLLPRAGAEARQRARTPP